MKRNFLSFFFTRTILKVFIELVTILLLFEFFFFFFHGVLMVNFVCYFELKDDQRTGETVLLAVSLRLSPEDRSI